MSKEMIVDQSTGFRSCLAILLGALIIGSSANARQCLPQSASSTQSHDARTAKIIIAADDHPHFKDPKRRCSYYWPYYEGKVRTPDGQVLSELECRQHAGLLDLSKGYAPLGVFFRSQVKAPESDILNYAWEIRGPKGTGSSPLLARYDAFNAAYVFEQPGEYMASLDVTFRDGTVAHDTTSVVVWPRDRDTYYVDAKVGDDRYDGLAMTPDQACDVRTRPVGACQGPWKTATRAFSVLDPRDWKPGASGDYTPASVCVSSQTRLVASFRDGLYAVDPQALEDSLQSGSGEHSAPIRPEMAFVCQKLRPNRTKAVRPGDQILFKRGQEFNLETGMLTVEGREGQSAGNHTGPTKLACSSIVDAGHWKLPMGIRFGAYGAGTAPVVKNTGQVSCTAFRMLGVGAMHLAFEDLSFNLNSASALSFSGRASFLFALGHPVNLVFNRVTLSQFNQGMLFHDAHGMFIAHSQFHDSNVVHLYSETATDVALLANKFDYSGNHIAYTNMSNALVVGNTFSRQAFGRTAIRVFGTSLNHPTTAVWVSDNVFAGWIDPRTRENCKTGRCQFANGKRYNYSLVEFHPNTPVSDKFSERIVFTRNVLRNAENMLRIGAVHELTVQNNIFDTKDISGTSRILLHSNGARRPLRNVTIKDNLFVERAPAQKGKTSANIELMAYSELPCDDIRTHEGIRILDNQSVRSATGCFFQMRADKKANPVCVDALTLQDIHDRFDFDIERSKNRAEYLRGAQKVDERIGQKSGSWIRP